MLGFIRCGRSIRPVRRYCPPRLARKSRRGSRASPPPTLRVRSGLCLPPSTLAATATTMTAGAADPPFRFLWRRCARWERKAEDRRLNGPISSKRVASYYAPFFSSKRVASYYAAFSPDLLLLITRVACGQLLCD